LIGSALSRIEGSEGGGRMVDWVAKLKRELSRPFRDTSPDRNTVSPDLIA